MGWQLPLPRARVLQRKLTVITDENRVLRLEIEAAQDAIEAGIDRQARALVDMQGKVDQLEEERNRAARQVKTLQDSLSLAVSRQESTERRVTTLDESLQKTRASHQAEMQEAHEHLRRQARRSTGAMLVAALAMILAVVASVTGVRDVRENTRILVDMSEDLRGLKSAVEPQQAGHQRALPASAQGDVSSGEPFR
jgi:chromosome segregation ATPase